MKRNKFVSRTITQNQISQLHIADGFYDDCDELITRCARFRIIDYQTFALVWQGMNLGFLYQGRECGAEISELAEELVHIAKQYMVRDTSNLEESIVGLFLVYGLFKFQPYSDFAWMRISPADVPALRRLEMIARRDKRYDVLYILAEVMINHSQYHVGERERGIERSQRKYLEGCTTIGKFGLRPKGVFFRQNVEVDLIRDICTVTRSYGHLKRGSVEGHRKGLEYIVDKMADEFNESLRKLIDGIAEESDKRDDEDSSEDDHFGAVQLIKQRAMANVVNAIKHLTGIEERKTGKDNTSEIDLKPPMIKVKASSSPTKPKSKSRTRKKSAKNTSPKKTKKLKFSDLSDQDDLNMKDINIDALANWSSVDDKLVVPRKSEELELSEGDLDLDSLPVIMRTEKYGDSMERLDIEILNELKEESKALEIKPSTSATDTARDGNVSKKKMIKTKKALSTKLKTLERRDMKRNFIKPKFKKMGMLPAANFFVESSPEQ